jgi:PAS domain S-box-containing protein
VLTFTDITARKEAEEAQLASEAGLRTISDAAPAMVWVCNAAGEATFFNQRWFDFTGQAEDASLKSGWASAMHPEDARGILPYWERCRATGEVYEGEVRYQRMDGEYRWHHFRALPRRNAAGAIEAWYGVSVDIHDSKVDNEALLQSEDGFRLLLSASSDALYKMSADWSEMDLLEGNGFLADTRSPSTTWLEQHIPEGEQARTQAAIDEAIRTKSPFRMEHRVVRADGSQGWVFSRATPQRDESGEIVAWFGAASDITERKQAEEAMRASQERMRLLGESAQDFAIIWLDTHGCVTEWSAGAERVLGFTSSEMLGQSLHCIFTPEDVAAGVPEGELRTAEREGRAIDERWHLKKDGSRVFLSGAMTSLRAGDGALLGFVKIVRDGSEARRIEDELHESQARLAIALDAAQLGTCDWNYLSGEMQGNARRFKLFGLDPRQGTITEEQFRASIHPDDRAATWEAITQGIEERGEYRQEFRVVLPGGEVRWITESGRVVERKEGRPRRVAGILWDITERHAAQQVLERSHDEMQRLVRERAGELARVNEALEAQVAERKRADKAREFLLRRLVATQEEERRRLARELHDQMGQSLTALMMGLKSLPSFPESGPETSGASPSPSETLTRLQGITTDLMNEVHHLAWELRPAVLDNLGLRPALEESVRAWSQRSGVRADFLAHSVTAERFPLDIESALYRVTQEALTNVARHSGAQHVSVLLERVMGEVVLIVEDDGNGFDVEARANSGRLGMAGMRERIEMVGGTLNIESSPDAGTTIYVRIPLTPPPGTDAAAQS